MTVTTTMPASLVVAPARVPLPFGLFSTFTFRPDGAGVRWEAAGVEFDTPPCGPLQGVGFGGYCADPDAVPGLPRQLARSRFDTAGGTPFSIVAAHKCSPVANTADAARQAAEAKLLAGEERTVEHVFATGLLGNTPNLRGAAELTTAAVPVDVGIGLLEEFLAVEYGHQGIIHVPRFVAAASPGSFRAAGMALRTAGLGTPVAAGAGYDGSSPDGDPPAGVARWIYATGSIAGYRSDPVLSDLFDQKVNDQVAYAERSYLLAFEDCGVAAALVTADLKGGAVALPDRQSSPYLII